MSGAGKRSRTPDLRITNALLYQLSYTGVWPDSRKCRFKSMSLSHFYELAHCVTAKRSEICKLRDMGSAAALEKIEQGTGRARQDPVLGEVCLGH